MSEGQINASASLGARLCILSSSSSGNCSVLHIKSAGREYTVLIDAGLSPRRTREFMARVGLSDRIDHVLLTHLDHDHWYAGWINGMPKGAIIHMHRRHRGRGDRMGATTLHTELFTESFEIVPGVVVHPLLVAHDDLGTAAFRIEFSGYSRSLGFATDTGRPTQELCDHLMGVQILAIESNYCPQMQLASDRPAFLKNRIMGGKGHLSNQESARAVARIRPTETVVLLHLSRQCNTPETAAQAHGQSAPRIIVSRPDQPSEWLSVVDESHTPGSRDENIIRPSATLWESS